MAYLSAGQKVGSRVILWETWGCLTVSRLVAQKVGPLATLTAGLWVSQMVMMKVES